MPSPSRSISLHALTTSAVAAGHVCPAGDPEPTRRDDSGCARPSRADTSVGVPFPSLAMPVIQRATERALPQHDPRGTCFRPSATSVETPVGVHLCNPVVRLSGGVCARVEDAGVDCVCLDSPFEEAGPLRAPLLAGSRPSSYHPTTPTTAFADRAIWRASCISSRAGLTGLSRQSCGGLAAWWSSARTVPLPVALDRHLSPHTRACLPAPMRGRRSALVRVIAEHGPSRISQNDGEYCDADSAVEPPRHSGGDSTRSRRSSTAEERASCAPIGHERARGL